MKKKLYKVGNNILITNWIHQINSKSFTLNRLNQWKESNIRGNKYFVIEAIISKIKHSVLYAHSIGTLKHREDIKVDQEIKVSYDCIIQIA